jgi:hypothetical protein
LGGPQSRSGRFGEEKILDPTGTRTATPRSFSPQLVAIPATLSRLLNCRRVTQPVNGTVNSFYFTQYYQATQTPPAAFFTRAKIRQIICFEGPPNKITTV